MDIQEILAVLGLGDVVVDQYLMVLFGVLLVSAFMLLGSMVFSMMAFRAAGRARSVAEDVATDVAAVARMSSEARELKTEFGEYAAQFSAGGRDDREQRYDAFQRADGDQRQQDYADQEDVIDLEDNDRAENVSAVELEAAKRAATEPSALLSGYLRRR